jgi:chromate reductase
MSDAPGLKILGIAGSLRKASINRGLLRAAQAVAPKGMLIDIYDISPIPLYDDDVQQREVPETVKHMRAAIAASDAVLIATPEYNYSIPGVLKNAIDWASRPPQQPFHDKPVAIMGASAGIFGTTRAQHHLRQCFVFLDARVLSRPEVTIPAAKDKFDSSGDLIDAASRQFVAEQLEAFEAWTRRLLPRGV